MDRNKMKDEAVRRMERLVMPRIVSDFKETNAVYVSERVNDLYDSILYLVANYEGLQEEIKKFEEESGGLVYHVQLTRYNLGGEIMNTYSFLYVSEHEEEWEADRNLLLSGETLAYVYNETRPYLSELGFIGVEPSVLGGIVRTW